MTDRGEWRPEPRCRGRSSGDVLTFEPEDRATRMRWAWVEPKKFARALGPLVDIIGRREERTVWTGLKHHLEGSPDHGGPIPSAFIIVNTAAQLSAIAPSREPGVSLLSSRGTSVPQAFLGTFGRSEQAIEPRAMRCA